MVIGAFISQFSISAIIIIIAIVNGSDWNWKMVFPQPPENSDLNICRSYKIGTVGTVGKLGAMIGKMEYENKRIKMKIPNNEPNSRIQMHQFTKSNWSIERTTNIYTHLCILIYQGNRGEFPWEYSNIRFRFISIFDCWIEMRRFSLTERTSCLNDNLILQRVTLHKCLVFETVQRASNAFNFALNRLLWGKNIPFEHFWMRLKFEWIVIQLQWFDWTFCMWHWTFWKLAIGKMVHHWWPTWLLKWVFDRRIKWNDLRQIVIPNYKNNYYADLKMFSDLILSKWIYAYQKYQKRPKPMEHRGASENCWKCNIQVDETMKGRTPFIIQLRFVWLELSRFPKLKFSFSH